ncbi:malonyl CoA-acyl carrier protein transacylase [Marinobacterium zhoushanense]|uniref:Malonyl CoA-acyl carrier protein transacylase n=1 Tax=Marinobacterium zhoushanense TaxID=1679163 RepID=A0ABQ1K3C5_9GAMM|nr:malonate decarboxylase subunit epsilon [Marinobacterium zhoushanense]GGB82664.1 malonyl CoA-acyl carrier protein transacylase [Marinobacterium zhoushanense]
MLTAFTFPGQGAQRAGMLAQLPHTEVAEARVHEAEKVLGQAVRTLDTAEALTDTRNVQLSLLISGVIWGEHFQQQSGKPDFVLGLSIGAYPAAVVAGILEFSDALQLVALRGQLMQQAYPSGYGMLALIGASRYAIETVVNAQRAQGRDVFLANLNAEQQFVLAGERSALRESVELLKASVPCAGQMLDVPVPSHCELLSEQAEILAGAFAEVEIRSSNCRYVSATRARVLHKQEDIRRDLAQNMSLQMHWHDSCQMLVERGLERVIEMPPGNSLTGLFRRVLPSGICKALQSDIQT